MPIKGQSRANPRANPRANQGPIQGEAGRRSAKRRVARRRTSTRAHAADTLRSLPHAIDRRSVRCTLRRVVLTYSGRMRRSTDMPPTYEGWSGSRASVMQLRTIWGTQNE